MNFRLRKLLCLAGALMAVPVASAWVRDGAPLWPDGPIPLHLQLGTSPTYSDGTTANTTAIEALAAWNSAIARVQFTGISSSTAPIAPRNQANNIFFSSSIYGQAFGSGVLAVTVVFTAADRRSEADVIVNQGETWDSYRGVRQAPDLRRVLTHEFGHVLGLGHPDENGESVPALMNSRIGPIEAPESDDLDGAAALYGVGIGRPGSTRPTVEIGGQDTLEEGEAFHLRAFSTGTSPLTYQWYQNGVAIAGANRPEYRKARSLPTDTGLYTVVVTNPAGAATSNSIALTVRPALPPVIASIRSSGEVAHVGATVEFSVRFSGRGPFTFTWRRNGVIISESQSFHPASTADLKVEPVDLVDAGIYSVTIQGALGSATSDGINLLVRPAADEAPIILTQMASSMVEVGARAGFSPVVSGASPMRFEWRKDGVLLANQETSSLFIRTVTEADFGVYTFTASNRFGSIEGAPARLQPIPLRRLRIKTQPISRRMVAPGFAHLFVEVEGSAPIRYQWFKDGVPISNGTDARLNINPAVPADLGVFTVSVSNPTERVVSDPGRWSFDPSAQLLPQFAVVPAPLTVRSGQPAELHSSLAYTFGNFLYQWRKDGVAVPGQTNAVLRLAAAQPGDAGDYSLAATNAAGTSITRAARLTVTDSFTPIILRNPHDVQVQQGDTAYFEMELAPNSWRDIRWQFNGIELPERRAPNLAISAMNKAMEGNYRAVIATTAGETVYSEPAKLTIVPRSPPFIGSVLPDIAVPLGDSVTFHAVVERADSATFQWRRDGVRIPGATSPQLYLSPVRPEHAATYSLTVTNPAGSVTSNEATLSIASNESPIILQQPVSTIVAQDQSAYFTVRAYALAGASYQWQFNDVPIAGGTDPTLAVPATPARVGRYRVVVSNSAGSVVSDEVTMTLLQGSSSPLFLLHPEDQFVASGSTAVLSSFAQGAPPLAYQWLKDGQELPGATNATLAVAVSDGTGGGNYAVVVRNSQGQASSQLARLAVDPAGRLLNLSARARSRGGDDPLITGFVVQGPGAKRLLLRGVGPALKSLGVAGALTDPRLTLYDAGGRQLQTQDNWEEFSPAGGLAITSQRLGAFEFPAQSKDAAVIATLSPGAYTVHVSHMPLSDPAVGLVEIYDAENGAPRLINLSTRARVDAGEGALIAGFVVDAGASKRVLVRAVGPALAAFGVEDGLADPTLELFRGGEAVPIHENDNWGDGDTAETERAFRLVSAFPLPAGSKDSAMVVLLSPGAYTAKVSGVNGAMGTALIEVYELVQ